jgi:predicted dehydrogenase
MGVRLWEAARRADLEVPTILDSDPDAFGLTAQPESRAAFTTDAETFWGTPVDILVIATTAPGHMPLLREGLARGIKRFVLEKPLATSVSDADETIRKARSEGARILVNHTRRYCPNFNTLASRLNGGAELGSLRMASMVFGGGSLGCNGPHAFDLFNLLFGEMPEAVMARMTSPQSQNVRGSQFDDPGGTVMLFTFQNEFSPWEVRARKPEDRDKPMTQYGAPLVDYPFPGWQDFSMMERWTALMRDAAADGPAQAPVELGLNTTRIFAAARWSAQTDQLVRFPLSAEAESAVYPIP